MQDPADTWVYGYDNSRQHQPPGLVIFAETQAVIPEIVSICYQHGLPITAHGRGTGTTGGAVPVAGSVVLSLERLNRLIEVDATNRVIRAEAGVINQDVQNSAAEHGFFWPPDPTSSAYCTIGGNLALNAAGPRAVKYGTPRENVLGLCAITGTGKQIRTGVYTTKVVVGYDLTRLLIGSEGTLAIITEATLKLTPLAECRRVLRLIYRNIDAATQAITDIMAQPSTPSALEFMDQAAIDMIREYTELVMPDDAGAILIIEVDGPLAAIDSIQQQVIAAATNTGLIDTITAGDDQEEALIWQTRKALSPALRKIAPNKLNEDVVVPVSNIPRLISGLSALSKRYGIPIINFGHAGNGNIHVNLLYDAQDPEQAKQARPCLDAVFQLVIDLKGTISGQHGIGLVKRDYIGREIDPVTLQQALENAATAQAAQGSVVFGTLSGSLPVSTS